MLSSPANPLYYYMPLPNINTKSNTRLLPANFYGGVGRSSRRLLSVPQKPASTFKFQKLSCSCPPSQTLRASSFPVMISKIITTRPQTLTSRTLRNQKKEETNAPNNAEEKELNCSRLVEHLKKCAFKLFRSIFVAEPEWDAIVKITCAVVEPDSRFPWRKVGSYLRSTGFIIDKKRILTCAHCVEYHTKVRLKKQSSNTEYEATVLAIAPECDLALLTVTNDEFWKEVRPLKLGNIPALKDNLIIAGFPNGQDRLDKKSRFLSHMDMIEYTCWPSRFLALQVNVGVDRGNSGGPVLDSWGNCVGIVFENALMVRTSNLVPTPVIKHFIQDYEKNGTYTGFPIFAANWQKMENHDMCTFMGMRSNQKAILIGEVVPNYPEFEVLKPHDIILSIDGVNIARDRFPFVQGQRIDFSYLVMQKYVGDNITVEVLRNSNVHKFSIKLPTHKQFVPNTKGRPLSYFHMAGLVFATLSVAHLQYHVFRDYCGCLPDKLMSIALHDERVVVCKVFKNELNAGYEEHKLVNHQVLYFNDKPVNSLKSLVMMVESCDDEFLKFDFDNHQVVLLQTEKAKATKPEFREYHLDV